MLRTKNHGRPTTHGACRTDIWNTKSLPEQNSGETKMGKNNKESEKVNFKFEF